MTLTPGRDSTLVSTLLAWLAWLDLAAEGFATDFLFVTGAFDCTDTGVAFFDAGFALVAATGAVLGAAFLATAVDGLFVTFLAGASLLAAGDLLATFFAAGFFAAAVAVLVVFTALAGVLAAAFFAASA
jgi:hypothetical protein